jgi:hypothetical protein
VTAKKRKHKCPHCGSEYTKSTISGSWCTDCGWTYPGVYCDKCGRKDVDIKHKAADGSPCRTRTNPTRL